jgi:hypothetical protein
MLAIGELQKTVPVTLSSELLSEPAWFLRVKASLRRSARHDSGGALGKMLSSCQISQREPHYNMEPPSRCVPALMKLLIASLSVLFPFLSHGGVDENLNPPPSFTRSSDKLLFAAGKFHTHPVITM